MGCIGIAYIISLFTKIYFKAAGSQELNTLKQQEWLKDAK